MTILYLETNFLLSVATGRDAEADTLLTRAPAGIRVVIPGPCFMEALSAFEGLRKDARQFKQILQAKAGQFRRVLTSSHARALCVHLEQSEIENQDLINEIQARLSRAMIDLARVAEQIHLDPEIIESSCTRRLIEEDPTDNLILHCILHHAARHPGETRAFLSENTRDFGTVNVKQILADAGVKYFSEVRNLLAWIGASPPGPPGAAGGTPAQ